MKKEVSRLLSYSDIKINGNRPQDIQVHNEKFYSRVLSGGSLALGESYMDGWWDCKSLDQFFERILRAKLDKKIITPGMIFAFLKSKIMNIQSFSKSRKNVQHYNIGNEFYAKMLDKNMQYTCGYWDDAKDLEQAQKNKLDLICKKLKLKKGDHVLELGSGWGYLAKYATEKYGCRFTCYNISKEQIKHAREMSKGLPIEFIEDDYRNARGKYDKVVSIGMLEHVGYKNHRDFMEVAYRCLKDEGIFLAHSIGNAVSAHGMDPWIDKYIFPNSLIPSMKQISTAAERLFVIEDVHNLSTSYDKTLMAWFENFDKNWKLFSKEYGARFYRMWKYYLLSCAGAFRARQLQLYQIVFSKGLKEGYISVRS